MTTRCALASARSGPGSTWFFTPASSQSVGQAPGLPTLLLDACSGHREADLRLLLSLRERRPPLPKTQQRAQPSQLPALTPALLLRGEPGTPPDKQGQANESTRVRYRKKAWGGGAVVGRGGNRFRADLHRLFIARQLQPAERNHRRPGWGALVHRI